MPPATIPALTLSNGNGVTMTALGLGVFQTPPEETRDDAVGVALDVGRRRVGEARDIPEV